MPESDRGQGQEESKLERGFKILRDMLDKRRRGKVRFVLDGSGRVNEVEVETRI
jgi:hypothetical protein